MLLAADLLADTGLPECELVESDLAPEFAELNNVGQESAILAAEGEAEGENGDQPDLVAFAELLTLNGVKFYGSGWCPNCVELKKSFEDGAQLLTYIELYNPDGTRNDILPNLEFQPAMEFPDGNGGTTLIQGGGQLTLERISQETGIAIPTSSNPWVKPIDETLKVLSGSPLHIPLDGYDPNGDPLTYDIIVRDASGDTVDPSLFSAEVLENNRSMKVNLLSYPGTEPGVAGATPFYLGEMVFELFEQRAPDPSGRVIQLAESGYYDSSYMWRSEPGFVFQFGGTTPTGGGGSTLGIFDDQFHVDLQHNRDGVLSYAKAGDDTNDAQFFLTLDPTRSLDFNHAIFGQLVEGFPLLDIIQEEPVFVANPDDDENPNNDIHSPVFPKQLGGVLAGQQSVEIFRDDENSVAMLKAHPDTIGQDFTLTVTATDSAGNVSQTPVIIDVRVEDDIPEHDGANGGPFLEDIGEIVTTRNTPAQIQLSSVDVEGDPVYYDAVQIGDVPYTGQFDSETGVITITPPDDFVGEMEVRVRVAALNGSNTGDPYDTQDVTITVLGPPTLDLLPNFDSNINNDNITKLTDVTFRVSDAVSGAFVKIMNGETVVGQGTASSAIDIPTDNLGVLVDGAHSLYAVQTYGDVESEPSSELVVTLDRAAPDFTTTAPDKGTVGVELTYDADTNEVGTTYAIVSPPAGATFSPTTGVVTWTPEQGGTHDFQIEATDVAGNSTLQDISIEVIEPVVRIILATTDLQGNAIDSIAVDSDYLLRVFIKDIREPALAEGGVFSSYLNIQYDLSLVSANAAGPDDIIFADEYTWLKSGNFETPGVIADVGSSAAPDPDYPTLFPPFGPATMLHFSIPMTATAEGTVEFSATPSLDPFLPIAAYAHDGAVLPEEVVILGRSLVIGEGLLARDDLFNVDEDSKNNELDVIDNPQGADENPQGGTITITGVGPTSDGGEVVITDEQRLKYEPASDFFGEEEFTYTISNGQSTSTATVTVQVFPINDDPTAEPDTFDVGQNSQDNFLDVLENDGFDPDKNEVVRVTDAVTDGGGAATVAPNGTHINYTPEIGFVGQETITYTISDGNGGVANATATVMVQQGTRPTAEDDEATVQEDSGATVIDVLQNDTAAEDGQLKVESVAQPVTGGRVTIGANGADVSYTPAPNFFGTDTFTYTVAEVGGGKTVAEVTVTINGENDPPKANDDDLHVTKNSENNSLNVRANDTDLPDAGETLVITGIELVTADRGSTFSVSADGKSIIYTPPADFVGSETFTYTITDRDDGSGLEDQATLTVNVAESTINGWITSAGAQKPIRGLQLNLIRVDGQNGANDSPQTDASGYFQSAATPGLYMLDVDPPFLRAIKTEVQVTSGGDATADPPEASREAKYMAIADFTSTAPGRSSLSPKNDIVAAVTPGITPAAGEGEDTSGAGQQHWYTIETGWTGYVDVQVQLHQDLSQATLTATATDGDQYQATIPTDDPRGVEFRGREGDARLIRIKVDPALLDWQLLTDHANNGSCSLDPNDGCAEGEASPDEAVAIDNEPEQATSSVEVVPAIEQVAASSHVATEGAEGEAAVGLTTTVATPVVSVSVPVAELITEVTTTEAVADTTQSLDSPTSPIPGIGTVDVSTDSTFDQRDVEDTPVYGESTTEAVDAVLGDPALEEEIVERDLVLVGSQSEADEFALAVDWLLAGGLD